MTLCDTELIVTVALDPVIVVAIEHIRMQTHYINYVLINVIFFLINVICIDDLQPEVE